MSASATLSVSVTDVNDNKPIFEKAFYAATLKEDVDIGNCFLKVNENYLSLFYFSSFFIWFQVEATDLDCGINSEVSYHIKETNIHSFRINEKTGDMCIVRELDHEIQNSYGFTVIASDKGK